MTKALEAVSRIGKPELVEVLHTPTPYHIESVATSAFSARVFICDANGSRVTDINCGDDDAKFIVSACNAHDALVESNKQARVMMRNVIGRLRDAGKLGVEIDILEQAVDAVNDALKLARGEG